MLMHFLGDEAEAVDPTPMKRWGRPEEIAAAACYLASDRASCEFFVLFFADLYAHCVALVCHS